MISLLIRFTFLLILILSSCKINPNYEVTGVVIEKNTSERIMTIDHDKIEGFMEPMVMNLNIHSRVDMNQINVMDSVKFNLIITKDSHYAINFEKLGERNTKDFESDFWDDEDISYSKKVGEIFDNVIFSKTDNTLYTLYDSNKEFTIISYIFTRCPIPNMCPAVISKNQFLADLFKNNQNIEFILISFDYIYDTPEVLLSTYQSIESNHPNIIFLSSTGHYNDLISLTKQSDVSFGGVEENNIGHTLRTIILDKDKKLLKIYEDVDWKPSELKRDLSNFINLN